MAVFLADSVFWGYFFAVLIIWVAGWVVSSGSNSLWYKNLPKSNLNPPNWTFFVVWTILYILLIIAGYVGDISAKDDTIRNAIRWVFGINLILTVLWSMFFFGWQEIEMAGVINLLIIGTIIALMVLYIKDNSWAVYLLIPYLIWTVFAFYLTLAILRKNRKVGYYEGGAFSGSGVVTSSPKDIITQRIEEKKKELNSVKLDVKLDTSTDTNTNKGIMDRLEPLRRRAGSVTKSVIEMPGKIVQGTTEEIKDLVY